MKNLSDYRKSYEKSELLESNIPEDPINLFNRWFHETEEFGGNEEVNAMTVATIGLDGFPKSRVVLLKKYTEEGFIFYTNYSSPKAKDLKTNSYASLLFFWPEQDRQIRIDGRVAKTSREESERYFRSRSDEAKLASWISEQSQVIESRRELEQKWKALQKKFQKKPIPLPPFWGGYRLIPDGFEFWQGRERRLNDRLRYCKKSGRWRIERLQP